MTTEENNTKEDSTTPEVSGMASNTTIGQLIRKKREEKGLSLKVISQQTKIHIGLLEYLENDQIEKLPSKTYVRGFVKSTCKILSIDQELALHLLDIAYANEQQTVSYQTPSSIQEMKTETARNTLSAIASTPLETVKSLTASSGLFLAKSAAVIIVVGIVGFNIKSFLDKPSEDNEVQLPKVLTTFSREKTVKIKPPAPPVVETPKTVEPLKINLIDEKTHKPDITINNITLKAISIGEKQFVNDSSTSAEKIKEIFPGKYQVETVKGTESVFINASEGDSWLTYKVDDKDIKKFVLRQGRTLFLRGAVIRLFIGNTYSLKVFHNNQLINLNPSNKSGIKNLVIPEEAKTKFMTPLFVFQKDGSAITSDEFVKLNQNPAQEKPIIASPSPLSAEALKAGKKKALNP